MEPGLNTTQNKCIEGWKKRECNAVSYHDKSGFKSDIHVCTSFPSNETHSELSQPGFHHGSLQLTALSELCFLVHKIRSIILPLRAVFNIRWDNKVYRHSTLVGVPTAQSVSPFSYSRLQIIHLLRFESPFLSKIYEPLSSSMQDPYSDLDPQDYVEYLHS